jgi:hypothetical protein
MPDRIIRDELLDSQRWLDLPTDTDRLAFVGLLLVCDDFGNLEGGPRRLFRFLHQFTQIKTPEAAATTLLHLADADMMRRYEVEKRELWHLPRFKPHRQYLVRKYPSSPWDQDREIGKNRRVIERGLALDHTVTKNIVDTSLSSAYHVAEGVGVGVGVGVNQKRTSSELSPKLSTAQRQRTNPGPTPANWAEFWKAKGKALGMISNHGESEGDYCRRVQAFAKTRPK